MAEGKKPKYLTKTVKFGGKSLSLYSIDGLTWSTKKDELESIKERQELQRLNLVNNKTGAVPGGAPKPKGGGTEGEEQTRHGDDAVETTEEESDVEPETAGADETEDMEGFPADEEIVPSESEDEETGEGHRNQDYDKSIEEEELFKELDTEIAVNKESEKEKAALQKKEKAPLKPAKAAGVRTKEKEKKKGKPEKPTAKGKAKPAPKNVKKRASAGPKKKGKK